MNEVNLFDLYEVILLDNILIIFFAKEIHQVQANFLKFIQFEEYLKKRYRRTYILNKIRKIGTLNIFKLSDCYFYKCTDNIFSFIVNYKKVDVKIF